MMLDFPDALPPKITEDLRSSFSPLGRTFSLAKKVLISDCIDIVIEIFVCAVIGSTYRENSYHELVDYKLLSIPFMVLAINQMYWFASVEKDNHRAIGRLIVLFVGMLAVTISESVISSYEAILKSQVTFGAS